MLFTFLLYLILKYCEFVACDYISKKTNKAMNLATTYTVHFRIIRSCSLNKYRQGFKLKWIQLC